ncbi:MAG: YraN family protein [Solirubrobacterales bacterium]
MTETRRALGRAAEELVASRLVDAGWRILCRNARTRYGEIDIVGMDSGVLVFVEVKAGRAGRARGPERPVLAVGPDKRRRIRRLAAAWLAAGSCDMPWRAIRFDAIGVTYSAAGTVEGYEHLRGAF